jgi:arylsulfatase
MPDGRPNILFFHVDNLGMGEIGCYGGGVTRGVRTERIDEFAREGLQLWHYIAEPQCTPSRSALMTGRYAIRSGTYAVPSHLASGNGSGGLVAWERTIADVLSEAGYATACYGKWHLGTDDGRWPTDHGFDRWYGPPRSYDECMWLEDPWYRPGRDPEPPYMYEGTREDGVTMLDDEPLDLERRREVDAEYKRRALDFLTASVESEKPFYLYFNHSLMHWPTIPRQEFVGATGNGEWADSLLELDTDFGDLLDALTELGVADDTIVVFAGDNGAEHNILWRGTPGVFEGSYFTASEGGLRTPCVVRWPGTVPAGGTSNEMVHQTDMFPTLLTAAGCEAPDDREIDGVDQTPLFSGAQEQSAREGCLVWLVDRLHAVKWHNFKVRFAVQRYHTEPPEMLSTPQVINLTVDPKELEPQNPRFSHSWVRFHARRLMRDFDESVQREPLIPSGAPVDHIPPRSSAPA